ncbi:MAG: IS256 family transposase [Nitrospirota bacterium]
MKKSLSKKAKKIMERYLEEIKEGFSSLAELTKVTMKTVFRVALEEELTEFLGRDYYERRDGQEGSRSGSKPRTIKVSCGDIEIEMPQVRDAGRSFHSKMLPPRVNKVREIEEVIPLLYMHGISTRKVKRAIGKLIGERGLSHQSVIRITQRIVDEFRNWRRRNLSELKVLYLILDGIRLGVRAGTRQKEAVLIAWAFLEDGRRELLSVSLGNQESYSAWKGFLEDMVARGLKEPLLIVIDGCPGLGKAVEELFPSADKQRCTKHRTENVLNKVLKEDKDKVKDSLRKIFYAPTYEHAKEAIELFKRDWGRKYPSAVEILMEDIELCLTYYKYPYRHWKRIRTTNAVERSFREVRGRIRGIGRFRDEERALMMVWWQMKELRWYGVDMTKEARAILAGIGVSKLEKVAA